MQEQAASRSVRTPAHVRRGPVDHWVITYCRDGNTVLSTSNGQLDARAGVPFVWSLARPLVSHRTVANRLQIYLPRDSFSEVGASLDRVVGSMLETPLGHLFCDYMVLLERSLPDLPVEDAGRLPKAVNAMLTACLAPSADRLAVADRQIDLTLMERVRQVVRRNLHSPSLGPEQLCREVAVSRSTLYRVLEGEGGVVAYVQRQRLSESFAVLSDVTNTLPIGKVAEMLCFIDASSFSRAFRHEFGISPSDVRVAARAGLAPPSRPKERPDAVIRKCGDFLRSL